MTSPFQSDDEFYINYGAVPPGYRRFLIKFIVSALVGVLLFTIVLPKLHSQYNLGRLHGKHDLEGLLVADPVPHLIVPRPGNADAARQFSRYLLTGTGKTNPKPAILEHLGQWVKLNGIVVSRNQLSVIAARSAEVIPAPQAVSPTPQNGTKLGTYSLTGEILDSKCYPGVMKPGQGKTHRACAIRCIAGGVPAVFRVQNQDQDVMYFLLTDTAGKAINDRVLDRVGDALRIQGDVVQYDDLYVLQADPDMYESV